MSSHNSTVDWICEKCGEKYTDKWCKKCQINYLKNNFINWTSENKKIDDYIQKMQLKIDDSSEIVFEWIPYNKFNNIEEIGKDDSNTIYSAIWKDGPLRYNNDEKKLIRESDKKFTLKCLNNSQNITKDFLNKAKTYSTNISDDILQIYGISQNPDTKDYIMVLQDGYYDRCCKECGEEFIDNWCIQCQINHFKENFTNWTSGNEEIDDVIQDMQLSISNYDDKIFEWIPYSQFNSIKEVGRGDTTTVFSAIWKDGPLYYDIDKKGWIRESDKKVELNFLYINADEFLDEVQSYLFDDSTNMYGISQDPDTEDYIMVLREEYNEEYYCKECGKEKPINVWCEQCRINYLKSDFTNWTSENEKIDAFIQQMQLEIVDDYGYDDKVFEWISYDQFNNIKEIGKDDFTATYSAVWSDGPLYYDVEDEMLLRMPNKKIILKCLYNSQNDVDNFLKEIEEYSSRCGDIYRIYGISQNLHTKNYIMVLHDLFTKEFDEGYCEECGEECSHMLCKQCLITLSENEKIMNLIKEMKLSINSYDDKIFEWIPYNQFSDIEEVGKSSFATVCSAVWKAGPLYYDHDEKEWTRESQINVALKCLNTNPQNITEEFLDKIKAYSINDSIDDDDDLKIYGISQNPHSKNYILVLQEKYCEEYCKECGEEYTDGWCKPCQLNYLKKDFTNWTSENEKIDNFIQETQLKINELSDVVFEWISYNQFSDIKEIGKNSIATVYSAIWKDGPLYYDIEEEKCMRKSCTNVALKCLYNTQNITDEFFDNVKIRSTDEIFQYGISQNPDTKNYIMVFHDKYCDEYCKKCGEEYIDKWCKPCQINYMKSNFTNWTSENEIILNLIQEMQSNINYKHDIVFELISYNKFKYVKEIGKGNFATVYSAIWKDGPLYYDEETKELIRKSKKKIALKRLHNSQNITQNFLNEVKAYSLNKYSNILEIYGISQNPDTKDYIIVLEYAEGGNFSDWMNKNYKKFNWKNKLSALRNICEGLEEIHQNHMIHRDFHTGNILFKSRRNDNNIICISDMGLCGEANNKDETKIYGVMPYLAPEVLNGKPYTQAADIFSFGMIMYFVATEKQPFADRARDKDLVLSITSGNIPEINEPEAPKCYIDLMKQCLSLNSVDRPKVAEIKELIVLFQNSYEAKYTPQEQHEKINKQFKEAEKYRRSHLSSFEKIIQPTSQKVNPYVKDTPKYDDKVSDNVAVEQLFLEHVEHDDNKFNDDNKHDDKFNDDNKLNDDNKHDDKFSDNNKLNNDNKFNDDIEHPKYYNSEFSDSIAVEQLLYQHVAQSD